MAQQSIIWRSFDSHPFSGTTQYNFKYFLPLFFFILSLAPKIFYLFVPFSILFNMCQFTLSFPWPFYGFSNVHWKDEHRIAFDAFILVECLRRLHLSHIWGDILVFVLFDARRMETERIMDEVLLPLLLLSSFFHFTPSRF